MNKETEIKAEWAGTYQNNDFWGFQGLRGYWNATAAHAVKCLPNRNNHFNVPQLDAAEIAALESAQKLAFERL